MELVSIGEAARRLELNTSALRYYEERGLLQPAARRGGRRLYGPEELRRLALIQILQRLGVGLDTAAVLIDGEGDTRRDALREQITVLDDLIARAQGARDFLQHAVDCPADHPVRQCPYMIGTLDRRVAGVSFEQLAAEHDHTAPPAPPKARSVTRAS